MDNCFTGRRDWYRQTPEKEVLYTLPAGTVTEFAFAWRTSFLSRHRDVIASFSLSSPIKTPSKLIARPVGRALPVHWIGY